MTGHVPGYVLAAVLCAALMHASWNALVKSQRDTFLATIVVVAGGGAVGALALPFLPEPAPASWPFIVASSAAQVLYYALLIETYKGGDMSLAYPLMRGSAPLLVALVDGPLRGERLTHLEWLAVALICGGILAMYATARANPATARRTTTFALMTACVIASYTMIDGAGVRRSGAPEAYTIWIFVLSGIGALAWAAAQRGWELWRFARANLPMVAFGGVTTLGSYGIALWP